MEPQSSSNDFLEPNGLSRDSYYDVGGRSPYDLLFLPLPSKSTVCLLGHSKFCEPAKSEIII
jgi:hypothetical protein